MISTVAGFDNATKLGILARAALSVNSPTEDFSSDSLIPNELELRKAVIAEVRKSVGVSQNDDSDEARDLVADFLDDESDSLLNASDETATAAALSRLSESGNLPSDLYTVVYDDLLREVYKDNYDEETRLIAETVSSPDVVQHFLSSDEQPDLPLVSLFTKRYRNKLAAKSFTMLVAGRRNGLTLHVMQGWRVYPHLVKMDDSPTPLLMWERFANTFGHELTIFGKTSKFLVSTEIPKNDAVSANFDPQGSGEALITFFQSEPSIGGPLKAALVLAIDLQKYDRVTKHYR